MHCVHESSAQSMWQTARFRKPKDDPTISKILNFYEMKNAYINHTWRPKKEKKVPACQFVFSQRTL